MTRLNKLFNRLGKRGEGGEEGLTIFAVIFAMAATFIIVFSITDWNNNRQKTDDEAYARLQDNSRLLNSLLSIRIDSEGTIYDGILAAHAKKEDVLNYGGFGRKMQAQINQIFKEERCTEIYVDGIKEYSTNTISSCTPRIDAETKYPAYGKEYNIRLVIG